MTIELSSEDNSVFLEFEINGVLTTDDLIQIANQLNEDHTIQKIAIEIAAETPAMLEPPTLIKSESSQAVVRADGDMPEQTLEVTSEQQASETKKHEPVNPTNPSPDQRPRLQPGGDPFAIMRIVAHHDEWIRTKEIADAIPRNWEVSHDALGSNLWNLEDRGFVEKRSYEADNRQNEYRITEIGERVLNDGIERAEDLQPIQ